MRTSLTVAGTVSDPALDAITVTIGGTTFRATVSGSVGPRRFRSPKAQLLTSVRRHRLPRPRRQPSRARSPSTAPRRSSRVSESGAPFTGTLLNRAVALLVRAVDADPVTQLTDARRRSRTSPAPPSTSEGSHTLERRGARLRGSRHAAGVRPSCIDRTPPAIRNLNPANGATVGTMPTSIAGSTDADAARIELLAHESSWPLPRATRRSNWRTFRSPKGPNRFTLRATDRAGNAAEVDYSVIVQDRRADRRDPRRRRADRGRTRSSRAPSRRVIRASDPAATLTATLERRAASRPAPTIAHDGDYTLIATRHGLAAAHRQSTDHVFTIDRTAPVVHDHLPAVRRRLRPGCRSKCAATPATASAPTSTASPSTLGRERRSSSLPTLALELGDNTHRGHRPRPRRQRRTR